MASLYVDRRDVHLQHDAGAIAFYENGPRSATVPLAPITRVILRGTVTLEASLLGHLGEHGIGLLFLTGRQGRPSLLLGRAHNDATRRVAQTRLSLDPRFCLRYASALIHRKIAAQREWFETLREHYPQARYPLTQALREVTEETGFDALRLRLVAAGAELAVPGTSPDRSWVVHPFLFDLEGVAEPRLDWEHVGYRWALPAELRGLDAVPRLVDALRACWPDAPGLDGEVPAD